MENKIPSDGNESTKVIGNRVPGKLINLRGLSLQEIPELQKKYGRNIFHIDSQRHFIHIVWDIVKEPMFILLVIACSLYFILGEASEGIMMLVAMAIVTAISLYQEVRSSDAVKALQQIAEPKIAVIRDGEEIIISAQELLPGDVMLLDEGMTVPADAVLLQGNDFSVNESVITGESLPVDKHESDDLNILYQGSTVNTGKCIARVTAIGNGTVLGKLGKVVGTYHPAKTLLQLQINQFVRSLALFGLIGFAIIFLVNYLHHHEWVTSLLFALTLAMSAVPEEIPVAFSSFMALGAYKMSKLGIISRQPQVIESLGAVSVICLDKTGTITENKMQVKSIYEYNSDTQFDLYKDAALPGENVLRYAVLASEQDPFDAMEIAIWEACQHHIPGNTYRQRQMVYEYSLEGKPPMMTHVYTSDRVKIAAAKGAAERIIRVCGLLENEKIKITQRVKSLASKGYRVIGVASAVHNEPGMPVSQDDFVWNFEGLLALYDPPKENINDVLRQFYSAGISIKLITGDYSETAMEIAKQVGILRHPTCVTGDQVIKMNDGELSDTVKTTNIFARMFPDAKLKVINALKANGEIVAMTGDGVNDGPALRSAHIGIAMGKKGTEIARQAADLILTDDNLQRMVTAIREGRKIFNNLKKAVRYIISIHIPIILIASLPLIFGWAYPNIFTPIHVIFMELIMGPTCSIFFEKEPVEENLMRLSPRERKGGLFKWEELFISILQGIVIAAGCLGLYAYFMNQNASLEEVRTIVFTTLILSNVFLTFVTRSFTKTLYYTIRHKNNLAPVLLMVSSAFLAAIHYVPFVRNLFQLAAITPAQFWLCTGMALVIVMWFELYKIILVKIK